MASVARSLGRDYVITGHPCSPVAPIAGTLNPFVDIGEGEGGLVGLKPAAVVGDLIAPHTILAGKFCVPHVAVVNTGSIFVTASGIPVARVGDSADFGVVASGSIFVWAVA